MDLLVLKVYLLRVNDAAENEGAENMEAKLRALTDIYSSFFSEKVHQYGSKYSVMRC